MTNNTGLCFIAVWSSSWTVQCLRLSIHEAAASQFLLISSFKDPHQSIGAVFCHSQDYIHWACEYSIISTKAIMHAYVILMCRLIHNRNIMSSETFSFQSYPYNKKWLATACNLKVWYQRQRRSPRCLLCGHKRTSWHAGLCIMRSYQSEFMQSKVQNVGVPDWLSKPHIVISQTCKY